MRLSITILFICLLFPSHHLRSLHSASDTTDTRHWYLPDFIPVQFAGNIGLISMGIGYQVLPGWQAGLMYGYVPEFVARSHIHLVTLKNTFDLVEINVMNVSFFPYAGLTATLETGNNSFLTLPSHYPSGYYRSNAFHAALLGGLKNKWSFGGDPESGGGLELYVETGVIDFSLCTW